jgi:hypothetical protein
VRSLFTLLAVVLVAASAFADEPLQLKALRRAPIRVLRDDERSVIGYLARGETVSVLDVSGTNYFVDARTVMGTLRGWIPANAVKSPPADYSETILKQHERTTANRELIERHEVEVGMTREQVQASLGKPEHRSRVHSREGEQELWFYTTYRYLPTYSRSYDEKGELRQVVSYQRVASGHKVVTFQGNEVTAVAYQTANQVHPAPRVAN